MYNNILLFIAALFLFNASSSGQPPFLPQLLFLPLSISLLGGFYLIAKALFVRLSRRGFAYQKIEFFLSMLALVFFEIILVCCQPGYYLAKLPFVTHFSALQSMAGLLFFIGLLVLIWLAGEASSGNTSGKIPKKEIVLSNLQVNIPVILPWLLISLLYDLIELQPFAILRSFADSPYGFILLALLALLMLPRLILQIWGCSPMPKNSNRRHLEQFSQQLNFSTEFYLWPLHKGKVLSAAVVGLIPGFRYILITPALLEVMDKKEIEAIVAHEIGHVKKWHLLLSILLIAGFGILENVTLEPVIQYLYRLSFLKNGLFMLGFSRSGASAFISTIPALLGMLLFFRFVLGYFIRNFERQADLYSFSAIGSSRPLISTFEKLAQYGGEKKEKKNWHHFGLGERISCLQQAENNRHVINAHNRKVLLSLAGYFLLVGSFMLPQEDASISPALEQTSINQLTVEDQALIHKKRAELIVMKEKAAWYRQLGDVLVGKKDERNGIASYEKSLQLDPYNPATLNNLAWLLIASEDLALRNPSRALDLALEAVQWYPNGSVYDTLAAVYWANGMPKEALKAEEKAIALNPGRRQYYQSQEWKSRFQNYQQATKRPKKRETNGIP